MVQGVVDQVAQSPLQPRPIQSHQQPWNAQADGVPGIAGRHPRTEVVEAELLDWDDAEVVLLDDGDDAEVDEVELDDEDTAAADCDDELDDDAELDEGDDSELDRDDDAEDSDDPPDDSDDELDSTERCHLNTGYAAACSCHTLLKSQT